MKNKNLRAFTLAEVLITIGIIGIVAALTILSLITNYKKVRTVTILKESYSIMQQAIKLSQDDNGDIDGWDKGLNGSEFFHKYFANYLKWQKEYTLSEINAIAPHYFLNGGLYTGGFYASGSSHFVLINGSSVSIKNTNSEMMLAIDTNGISKPNRIGIDTFIFAFTPEYGLQPWGDKASTKGEQFGNYDRKKILGTDHFASCNKTKEGKWCTALIIQDGWKISNDYPWK